MFSLTFSPSPQTRGRPRLGRPTHTTKYSMREDSPSSLAVFVSAHILHRTVHKSYFRQVQVFARFNLFKECFLEIPILHLLLLGVLAPPPCENSEAVPPNTRPTTQSFFARDETSRCPPSVIKESMIMAALPRKWG